MTVFYGPDIDINNIIFKKYRRVGINLELIPLKYKLNNIKNNLILQTPKLYIPFGVNKFKGKNYISLSFRNYEYETEIKFFLKKLNKITTHIEEFIKYIEQHVYKFFCHYNS